MKGILPDNTFIRDMPTGDMPMDDVPIDDMFIDEEFEVKLVDKNGKKYWLKNPISFSCVKSDDTPAESFKAEFFRKDCYIISKNRVLLESDTDFPEFKTIQFSLRDGVLFEGICDKQILSFDKRGTIITIYARSNGALLVDNEAMPQVYKHASGYEIFRNHIAPYGFFDDIRMTDKLDTYVVGKGKSEWEVYTDFCEKAAGVYPISTKNCVERRKSGRDHYTFPEKNQKIIELKHEFKRCDAISEVFVRDKNGKYSTRIENPEAKNLGIIRKRYMIPSQQWSSNPKDVQRAMTKSLETYESWKIKLLGLYKWWLNDTVYMTQIKKTYFVREISFDYNANLLSTTVTLY